MMAAEWFACTDRKPLAVARVFLPLRCWTSVRSNVKSGDNAVRTNLSQRWAKGLAFPIRIRPVATAFALLLAAVGSGCEPGLVWLPDWSGFVFTSGWEGSQKLHLYDLKSKQDRILVADSDTSTGWPGVSPDGKWVAMARFPVRTRVSVSKGPPGSGEPEKELSRRSATMQLMIYDLGGKEVHRSPCFPGQRRVAMLAG
jgi:hypothetical protein